MWTEVFCWCFNTVDGRNPAPVHYLQGFIHPMWCRISSINSRSSQKGLLSGFENWKDRNFEIDDPPDVFFTFEATEINHCLQQQLFK